MDGSAEARSNMSAHGVLIDTVCLQLGLGRLGHGRHSAWRSQRRQISDAMERLLLPIHAFQHGGC